MSQEHRTVTSAAFFSLLVIFSTVAIGFAPTAVGTDHADVEFSSLSVAVTDQDGLNISGQINGDDTDKINYIFFQIQDENGDARGGNIGGNSHNFAIIPHGSGINDNDVDEDIDDIIELDSGNQITDFDVVDFGGFPGGQADRIAQIEFKIYDTDSATDEMLHDVTMDIADDFDDGGVQELDVDDLTTSGSTAESDAGAFGKNITVDTGVNVSGGPFESGEVSINGGFDSSTDRLSVNTSAADTSPFETPMEYNATNGTLLIEPTGDTATATEFQQLFRNVTYNNTADRPDTTDREITFSLTSNASADTDAVYNPRTGRWYEHVANEGITWGDARDAANDSGGRLATIGSEAENEFIRDRVQGAGWIGAYAVDNSDNEQRDWYWIDEAAGDEAGQHFYNQTAGHVAWTDPFPGPPDGVPGGGEAVDEHFENWNPRHEPDNKFPHLGGQDYAYFCSDTPGNCHDGMWMDASVDSPGMIIEGYIVEYNQSPVAEQSDVLTASRNATYVGADGEPTADINANETVVEPNEDVEFSASGSSDAAFYEWDLTGNGVYDETGEMIIESFDSAGNYTVTLRVTDADGNTDNTSVEIEVENIEPPRVVIDGPSDAVRGEEIRFNGTNSTDAVGIEAFEWDFGDGSDNTSAISPVHGFEEVGTYTVTLTVTDLAGNTNTTTHSITIDQSDRPNITAMTVTNPADGELNVTFEANESLDAITVEVFDTDELTPSPDDSAARLFNLTTDDFVEDQDGADYVYTNTTTDLSDGNYTAKLTRAENSDGRDGGFGQEDKTELGATSDPFAGGNGSTDSPYEIANWHHLNNTRDELAANFTLVNDLDNETAGYDAIASEVANDGDGFEPIGNGSHRFEGTIDGDGHTISNLTIDRSTDGVGLIGFIENATVENLSLDSVNVSGDHRVGGLVGRTTGNDTHIQNVHVTGTIAGTSDVGGLVGSIADAPNVSKSSAGVSVSGDGASVGGLIGWGNAARVNDTYATGDVDGSGATNVGGLIGHLGDGTVLTSYAAGSVEGGTNRAGLIGQLDDGGSLAESYWDKEETGQSDAVDTNDGDVSTTVARSTADLQGEAAVTNMTAFDWDDTWAWVTDPSDDYPELVVEVESDDLIYSELSVDPTENVELDEDITANATLENDGDEQLRYNAPLWVDRTVVDRTEGSLSPGESIELEFTHQLADAGEIDVTIGNLTAESVNVSAFPLTEDFDGTPDEDWIIDGDASWGETHGGEQTLRLTEATRDQSGLGFYDQPFSSSEGILVEFEYYANEGTGADGIAFFLVDGDEVDADSIHPGASGGPLGYGYNRDDNEDGIPEAYLGVGFDEFGNFVREGGDDNYQTDVPDAVAIRAAGTGQNGYNYLEHTDVASSFGNYIDRGWRTVRITVVPDPDADESTVRVEMSWDGGDEWETVIDYTYSETPPENLKLGFTGSTGGDTNIHALDNVSVELPANLSVEVTDEPENVSVGETFEYEYEVSNGGPNDAVVTVENTLPLGDDGATDVTWSYATAEGSDEGSNLDDMSFSLAEDETATITVNATVGDDAEGGLNHTLEASGDGTMDPAVTTASANVTLTIETAASAEFVSGIIESDTPTVIELGFDRAVNVTAGTDGFTVEINGTERSLANAENVSGVAENVTLTLDSDEVGPEDNVSVSYDGNSDNLVNVDDVETEGFTISTDEDDAFENGVDPPAPSYVSANVSDPADAITITFETAVNVTDQVGPDDFELTETSGGDSIGIDAVHQPSVNASWIRLDLDRNVTASDVLEFSFDNSSGAVVGVDGDVTAKNFSVNSSVDADDFETAVVDALEAEPVIETAVADGDDLVQIRVNATNNFGELVAGAKITNNSPRFDGISAENFTWTDIETIPGGHTTGDEGYVLFNATSTDAGTVTVNFTHNPESDDVTVSFESGSPNASTSTATADPTTNISADGEDNTTVTVVVRDDDDNRIGGLSSGNFTVDNQPSGAENDSVTALGNGEYAFNVTHTVAENVTVNVSVDSVELDDTPELSFDATGVNASASIVEPDPTTTIVANGTDAARINISLQDANSNPVDDLSVGDIEVDVGDATNGTISSSSGDGNFSFDVTHSLAENVTVNVTVDGVELDDAPELEFVAGPVNASESSVTADSTADLEPDGSDATTVTVTVRDTNGNLLTDLLASDFDIGLPAGADNSSINTTNASDGEYEFTVTSSSEQIVEVTVNVSAVELDDSPSIEFEADGDDGSEPAEFVVLIDSTNAPIETGDSLTVETTIENTGEQSGTQEIELRNPDGDLVDSVAVSLGGGESTDVELTWGTGMDDEQTGEITVSSEDESETIEVSVNEPATFAVEVRDTNAPLQEGETLEVVVDLENVGDIAGEQTIELRNFAGTVVDDITVELDADESETPTLTWETGLGDAGTDNVEVVWGNTSESVSVELREADREFFAVSIADTNAPIQAGDTLDVVVDVENRGDYDGTQSIRLEGTDGDLITAESITLDGGESTTVTLEWETEPTESEDGQITVRSENDSVTESISITERESADFRVTTVETNGPVRAGETVAVTVEVENVGDGNGTADIDLFDFAGTVIDTVTITLGSGDETDRILVWETGSDDVGTGEIVVETPDDSRSIGLEIVQPPASPEFHVQVEEAPDPITEGDTLAVETRVENVGDETGEQRIELRDDEGSILDETSISLDGGTDETVILTWNTTAGDADIAELTVVSDDDEETIPVEVEVVGEETEVPASIDIEPDALEFGEIEVNTTVTRNLTVVNLATADVPLEVTTTTIVGQDPEVFDVVNGDAPFDLAPGESREIGVAFTPVEEGVRNAQLRILSNAEGEPQIDVWLSNTGAFIAVQEVAADTEDEDVATVNVTASDQEAGADLHINVSQPSTRAANASFDSLGMTLGEGGDFAMDLVHSSTPIDGGTPYQDSIESVVQYVTILHDDEIASPDVSYIDTQIEFRVKKSAVETRQPADVSLYRYDGDEWVDMDATLIDESGEYYRFVAETPGFSEFAITQVPADASTGHDCSLFGVDFGSFIICWYWWLMLLLLSLAGVIIYVRRRQRQARHTG